MNLELITPTEHNNNNFLVIILNTSLVAPGALAYRLQRHNVLNTPQPAKSKMATRGPKITNSMRKVDNGGEKWGGDND